MPTFASQAAPGLIGSLLWLALLHSTWLGLAVSALAALAIRGRSPGFRQAWLASSMLAVALGPPILAIGQYAWVQRRPADGSESWSYARISTELPRAEASSGEAPVESPNRINRPGFDPHGMILSMQNILQKSRPYVVTGYALLVTIPIAILAPGTVGVRRLRRESKPAGTALQTRAGRLGRRLRLRSVPSIRVHDSLAEPCLCGVAHPAVLLPTRWIASAELDEIDAVLAHELAHARRRDPLWNLFQRGVEALLFFHPPVRWLSQSLRSQSEFAADRLASRLTGDPLALARALEALARLGIDPALSRPVVAALGSDPDSLLPRIQELIGMKPQQSRMRPWPFLALPLGAIVAALTASAQEPPPSKPIPVEGKPLHVPMQAPKPHRGEAERGQVSLQVQGFSLKEGSWRDRLERHTGKPIQVKGKPNVWFAPPNDLEAVLKELQMDPRTYFILAPRVTTFDGDAASIIMPLWLAGKPSPADAPQIEVKSTGKISADRRRVALDVLLKEPDRNQPPVFLGGSLGGTVTGTDGSVTHYGPVKFATTLPQPAGKARLGDAPAPEFKAIQVSATVADGSSLLVDAGRYYDHDYLVLVTPRVVLLKEEEERHGIPVLTPAPMFSIPATGGKRLPIPIVEPSPETNSLPTWEKGTVKEPGDQTISSGGPRDWILFVGSYW
ncbi:MAG: M56 family metallopeptidase [Isosphaeraceae bacterium]